MTSKRILAASAILAVVLVVGFLVVVRTSATEMPDRLLLSSAEYGADCTVQEQVALEEPYGGPFNEAEGHLPFESGFQVFALCGGAGIVNVLYTYADEGTAEQAYAVAGQILEKQLTDKAELSMDADPHGNEMTIRYITEEGVHQRLWFKQVGIQIAFLFVESGAAERADAHFAPKVALLQGR